ncbi:unnamed protein product, partial [Discosporangium mesarthrocarpum]
MPWQLPEKDTLAAWGLIHHKCLDWERRLGVRKGADCHREEQGGFTSLSPETLQVGGSQQQRTLRLFQASRVITVSRSVHHKSGSVISKPMVEGWEEKKMKTGMRRIRKLGRERPLPFPPPPVALQNDSPGMCTYKC